MSVQYGYCDGCKKDVMNMGKVLNMPCPNCGKDVILNIKH